MGARVNAPWALLVSAELTARLGIDAQVMATDDGLVMRLLDTDQDDEWWASVVDALLLDPEDLTRSLSREITRSAVFAAKFRGVPAGYYSPAMRRVNAPVVAAASTIGAVVVRGRLLPGVFPMVLEAVRGASTTSTTCPRCGRILRGLRDGVMNMETVVETPTASPMAQTQMFSYISVFMYEADNPLGQQAAALEIDPTLLAELLSDADLRSIILQEAIDGVEADLQWRTPGRIRSADDRRTCCAQWASRPRTNCRTGRWTTAWCRL